MKQLYFKSLSDISSYYTASLMDFLIGVDMKNFTLNDVIIITQL